MPRKRDSHLPRGVFYRHGAYYRVVGKVWHRLGTDADALGFSFSYPLGKGDILSYARRLVPLARQNAKVRGIDFSLTTDDVVAMLHRANWACAVTKTPFSLDSVKGRKPYAPSIDRIDSDGGYTPDNCRIVCLAANVAMNVWGDSVFARLRNNEAK